MMLYELDFVRWLHLLVQYFYFEIHTLLTQTCANEQYSSIHTIIPSLTSVLNKLELCKAEHKNYLIQLKFHFKFALQ